MNARIISLMLIGYLALFTPQSASAHCNQWNELYAEVMSLYRQGQSDQAIPVARQAVTTAENRFGADHPYVATSLNVLGQLYFETGQYEPAEPLYTRALDIYEKSLGPESLGVAQTLTNMAGLYLKMNKIEEASSCLARAQSIYRTISTTRPIETPR